MEGILLVKQDSSPVFGIDSRTLSEGSLTELNMAEESSSAGLTRKFSRSFDDDSKKTNAGSGSDDDYDDVSSLPPSSESACESRAVSHDETSVGSIDCRTALKDGDSSMSSISGSRDEEKISAKDGECGCHVRSDEKNVDVDNFKNDANEGIDQTGSGCSGPYPTLPCTIARSLAASTSSPSLANQDEVDEDEDNFNDANCDDDDDSVTATSASGGDMMEDSILSIAVHTPPASTSPFEGPIHFFEERESLEAYLTFNGLSISSKQHTLLDQMQEKVNRYEIEQLEQMKKRRQVAIELQQRQRDGQLDYQSRSDDDKNGAHVDSDATFAVSDNHGPPDVDADGNVDKNNRSVGQELASHVSGGSPKDLRSVGDLSCQSPSSPLIASLYGGDTWSPATFSLVVRCEAHVCEDASPCPFTALVEYISKTKEWRLCENVSTHGSISIAPTSDTKPSTMTSTANSSSGGEMSVNDAVPQIDGSASILHPSLLPLSSSFSSSSPEALLPSSSVPGLDQTRLTSLQLIQAATQLPPASLLALVNAIESNYQINLGSLLSDDGVTPTNVNGSKYNDLTSNSLGIVNASEPTELSGDTSSSLLLAFLAASGTSPSVPPSNDNYLSWKGEDLVGGDISKTDESNSDPSVAALAVSSTNKVLLPSASISSSQGSEACLSMDSDNGDGETSPLGSRSKRSRGEGEELCNHDSVGISSDSKVEPDNVEHSDCDDSNSRNRKKKRLPNISNYVEEELRDDLTRQRRRGKDNGDEKEGYPDNGGIDGSAENDESSLGDGDSEALVKVPLRKSKRLVKEGVENEVDGGDASCVKSSQVAIHRRMKGLTSGDGGADDESRSSIGSTITSLSPFPAKLKVSRGRWKQNSTMKDDGSVDSSESDKLENGSVEIPHTTGSTVDRRNQKNSGVMQNHLNQSCSISEEGRDTQSSDGTHASDEEIHSNSSRGGGDGVACSVEGSSDGLMVGHVVDGHDRCDVNDSDSDYSKACHSDTSTRQRKRWQKQSGHDGDNDDNDEDDENENDFTDSGVMMLTRSESGELKSPPYSSGLLTPTSVPSNLSSASSATFSNGLKASPSSSFSSTTTACFPSHLQHHQELHDISDLNCICTGSGNDVSGMLSKLGSLDSLSFIPSPTHHERHLYQGHPTISPTSLSLPPSIPQSPTDSLLDDRRSSHAPLRKPSSRNQSGLRGVYYDIARKGWRAVISYKGKQLSKYFLVARLGNEEAKKRAIECRKDWDNYVRQGRGDFLMATKARSRASIRNSRIDWEAFVANAAARRSTSIPGGSAAGGIGCVMSSGTNIAGGVGLGIQRHQLNEQINQHLNNQIDLSLHNASDPSSLAVVAAAAGYLSGMSNGVALHHPNQTFVNNDNHSSTYSFSGSNGSTIRDESACDTSSSASLSCPSTASSSPENKNSASHSTFSAAAGRINSGGLSLLDKNQSSSSSSPFDLLSNFSSLGAIGKDRSTVEESLNGAIKGSVFGSINRSNTNALGEKNDASVALASRLSTSKQSSLASNASFSDNFDDLLSSITKNGVSEDSGALEKEMKVRSRNVGDGEGSDIENAGGKSDHNNQANVQVPASASTASFLSSIGGNFLGSIGISDGSSGNSSHIPCNGGYNSSHEFGCMIGDGSSSGAANGGGNAFGQCTNEMLAAMAAAVSGASGGVNADGGCMNSYALFHPSSPASAQAATAAGFMDPFSMFDPAALGGGGEGCDGLGMGFGVGAGGSHPAAGVTGLAGVVGLGGGDVGMSGGMKMANGINGIGSSGTGMNTCPIRGLYYDSTNRAWAANMRINGRVIKKSFSVRRYGAVAKQLAIEARRAMEEEFGRLAAAAAAGGVEN